MERPSTRMFALLLGSAIVLGALTATTPAFGGTAAPGSAARQSSKAAVTSTTKSRTGGLAIELYRGKSRGDGGTKVDHFTPSDRKQFFYAGLGDLKIGRTGVKWVFTALRTTAGENLKIAEAKASGLIATYADGNVSLPRDFPIGFYRVEIYVNDKLSGWRTYEVYKDTPAKIELYRGGHKDAGGTLVDRFAPRDREQYTYADLGRVFEGQNVIRWVYTALKGTAGSTDTVVGNAEIPGGVLSFATGRLTLRQDFPVGRYRVELFLNGKRVASRNYEVRAAP